MRLLSRAYEMSGGWGGIRTPGEREPTPVFKTGALNHSATHPRFAVLRPFAVAATSARLTGS
jgi:hypothetical protein